MIVDPKQTTIRRIHVRALRVIPLSVTIDNKNISVRLVQDTEWGEEPAIQNNQESEKEVLIEISPDALLDGKDATLNISSPELEYRAQTRIRLEAGKT